MTGVAFVRLPFRQNDDISLEFRRGTQSRDATPDDEVICAQLHAQSDPVILVQSWRVDGKEIPLTRGKLEIQSEGAEVFYRNVELRPLSREEIAEANPPKLALVPTAPPAANGMAKIFNGTDLTGWEGDPRLWRVENGAIVGETTRDANFPSNTFLVYRGGAEKGLVKDFELRLSYRIHGGNSGVQYRSAVIEHPPEPANKWRVIGYQAEVAGVPGQDGFLYHEGDLPNRGYPTNVRELCHVGDKVAIDANGKSASVGKLAERETLAATCRKGEWNDYVILARGNVLKHFLNGYQTIEVTDNDPKNALQSGIIALQLHTGPPMKVEFRDLRLKRFE